MAYLVLFPRQSEIENRDFITPLAFDAPVVGGGIVLSHRLVSRNWNGVHGYMKVKNV